MSRTLVLIHGRSQYLKDPVRLKAEWVDALVEGLSSQGLCLPDDQVIRFAFYGDTLEAERIGRPPDSSPDVIIRGMEENHAEELRFMEQVLAEVVTEVGIADAEVAAEMDVAVQERGLLNWEVVQRLLRAIDRRLPGGSGMAIALATRDVFHYLVTQTTRRKIDRGVAQAFEEDTEYVVVGHSLGSVVAHNVLSQIVGPRGVQVPLFVTIGSPLGVTRIRREIRPPRWPKGVTGWYNAFDERDVVSLYPLTPEHFVVGDGHVISNSAHVRNETSDHHGIAGYLSDPAVARTIWEALTAG